MMDRLCRLIGVRVANREVYVPVPVAVATTPSQCLLSWDREVASRAQAEQAHWKPKKTARCFLRLTESLPKTHGFVASDHGGFRDNDSCLENKPTIMIIALLL